MFGFTHAPSCSAWHPYGDEERRIVAKLGEQMLYGNGEDLVRRLDDTTRLMKVCADKGRPELLIKLDRRAVVTGLMDGKPLQAPEDVSWAVSYIDADPADAFGALVVGNHELGPVALPRRFDVIPARQTFLPSVRRGFLPPDDTQVRLYGWSLSFDELFGRD
jgi:hypothetical protein